MSGSRLFVSFVLFSGIVSGALDRPCAADVVTLGFSGSGTGSLPNNGNATTCFSGTIVYDTTQTSSPAGTFTFLKTNTKQHSLDYQLDGMADVFAEQATCETFVITTSTNTRKNFVLTETTGTGTSAVTTVITLVTSSGLSQSTLPGATGLPSPPVATSTITITNVSGQIFYGTITTVIRSPAARLAMLAEVECTCCKVHPSASSQPIAK